MWQILYSKSREWITPSDRFNSSVGDVYCNITVHLSLQFGCLDEVYWLFRKIHGNHFLWNKRMFIWNRCVDMHVFTIQNHQPHRQRFYICNLLSTTDDKNKWESLTNAVLYIAKSVIQTIEMNDSNENESYENTLIDRSSRSAKVFEMLWFCMKLFLAVTAYTYMLVLLVDSIITRLTWLPHGTG